ncbi:aminodeoxychorismate synthase component I [Neobacillus niacini]|uniref:aminodeoxychorismate synthase component I n=1 Tax=Neobacillus niacini TaxID=86668 RepID=UPI0021CB8500|nr:aminodeoxychorismate synthase component I [Neobacillus niacini]MCM3764742.1 aminodeoxychorismate synthase component I [Neobacillus niacini]
MHLRNLPMLCFEFADSTGKIQPLTFQKPMKVIKAHKIDDVLPCFQMVQEAVDDGYYAAGFLSYESAPAFDSAYKVKAGGKMPLLWFGIFQEPLHQAIGGKDSMYTLTDWKPSVSMDEYNRAITGIKHAIEHGDTYQSNYTIRLNSSFQGNELAFFEKLKAAQASNYCAYINTGAHSILSASPELFFHLKDDRITTRPMKGTVKRGKTWGEDQAIADWLYHSEKNRAENLMIVDLLRNDLGMIAEPGTVSVSKLFEIEHYPTVHQMTSTITAQVSPAIKLVDIFRALFPCGSITGAPKISTMNIISELENSPRDVYCGAIGFITPGKEAIFNVPIRTVFIEHQTGQATYGVGGGITWDSTTEGEYAEILAKARLLEENRPEFQLLESLLWDNGSYFLLEEHLNRLNRSAQYFGFSFVLDNVRQALHNFSATLEKGQFKVRLLLAKDGRVTIEGTPIAKSDPLVKVVLADKPVDKENLFLYHKTTNRDIYSEFQAKKPADAFDVLLWNQDGELTEFTNGNLVVEMDGQLWTPSLTSGLLAGTYRDWLLNSGEIREKTLTLGDLEKATKIWFINSVRKWLEVQLS